MPETRRPVQTIEVTYTCDHCDKGMMEQVGEMDPTTGDIEHECRICGHKQSFAWKHYPRFDHLGMDEKV